MMDKEVSPAPSSRQGLWFALFLVLLIVASSWLFMQRKIWTPQVASVHGIEVDRVFGVTMLIVSVLFVLVQGFLAFLSYKFRSKPNVPANHWVLPKFEKRFALVAGIIIFGVDLTLFDLGETQWFQKWGPAPPDAALIEVVGEQFMWNFRYPGPDGAFGRFRPDLVSETNPLGLDPTDPVGKDDIVSTNILHLVEGKPIRLRLRSKDVIHSFNLPYQRMRQDVVPGMLIEYWFIPNRSGEFEIVCSQICGLGHYRMKAFLTVESQQNFDRWIGEFSKGGN